MIAVLAPMSASMNENQPGDPKLGAARMVGVIKGRVWQREEHFLGGCPSDAMRCSQCCREEMSGGFEDY